MYHQFRNLGYGLFFIGSVCCSWPTYSAQKLTKKIYSQYFYSDNLDLSNRESRQSEHIFEVSPSLSYLIEKKQHYLESYYALQALHYFRGERDDKIFQRGFIRYQTPNTPKSFQFESFLRLTQEVVEPKSMPFFDVFSDKNTDVFSFLVSPSWMHSLTNHYNVKYQVSHGQVHYLNSEIDSSNDLIIGAKIGPNRSNKLFNISADLKKRWTYIGSNLDVHDEHFNLYGNYHLTNQLHWLTQLGYENFNQDTASNRIEGANFLTGFEWALTRRTKGRALLGRRSHGRSGEFSLNSVTKMHQIGIAYKEIVENSSRQNLRVLPQANPQNLTRRSTEFNPSAQNGLFIARLSEANLGLKRGPYVSNINIFYNRHQLVSSNQTERDQGINVNAYRSWFGHTSLQVNGGYAQLKFYDDQSNRRNYGQIAFTRNFAKQFSTSIHLSKFFTKNSFLALNTHETAMGVKFVYQDKNDALNNVL